MKQLKKLGSSDAKVLTGDQMKNVKGGRPVRGCTVNRPGPAMLCAAALCEAFDPFGNLQTGMCNSECMCVIRIPDLP